MEEEDDAAIEAEFDWACARWSWACLPCGHSSGAVMLAPAGARLEEVRALLKAECVWSSSAPSLRHELYA